MILDEEITALGERGWFVRTGFVGSAVAAAARREAEGVALRPAGMGRGEGYHMVSEERGDEIAWIEAGAAAAAGIGATPAIASIVASFEALRVTLNEAAYLGLERFDVQLARYAPGGRYVRHRDAHRIGSPATAGRVGLYHTGLTQPRRLTAILYLNPDWTPADGGQLRIHADPGEAPDAHDIEPIADRLVVFLSDRVEHEVLPSSAPRYALTAWYLGRS